MKSSHIRTIALVLFFSPVLIFSQWQTYFPPVSCNYWAVSVVNSSVIWAAGETPGTIVRTTDGGSSWLTSDNGLNDTINMYEISALDANTAWAVGGANFMRLFKTTNGGQNWTELNYPNKNFINKVHFFNASTGVMFVDHISPPLSDTAGYLITRNGGTNWYRSPNSPVILLFTNDQINILDTTFITFTAAKNNGNPKSFFRLQGSLDAQWSSYSLPSNYPAFVFFKDYNTGLGTGLVDSIYRTGNSGLNWLRIAGGGYSLHNGMHVPGTSWAVLYGGSKILMSYDFGSSFQPSVSVPSGLGYGDSKDSSSIWIAGYGGRLFKYNISFIGISQINSEIPSGFVLQQNYPNPFNPSTTIEFTIPVGGDVNFTVYDVSGREVYNVVEQNKQPGKYNISFNGSSLASGVYLYRLNSGNYSSVKKMVLTK
jgi:hypothetical protein